MAGESEVWSPGSACPGSNSSQTLYMWSLDAPGLDLPAGVGIPVGGDSAIHHLVLQVHYIRYTNKKMNFIYDIFLGESK